ncbi:MAG: hypothetical protein DRR11_07825 [Gammaproteobacteria bacterium]|nr:MAG: hypothetical protein DRR11_07825 [Gammaproteobacteria bacterium]RLA32617.1 MAG: hypothetical protein DRR15_11500 [Gammaproteobacteria bacterium]
MLLSGGVALTHEFSGAHGTVTVDWTAPNIARVLSSGYGDSFGTEAWARKGFPELVEVDGRQCVKGTYFLFDVDDDFAFDIDETVTIEFLFDRRQSAGLFVSYDQNVVAENISKISFPDSDDRWHSQAITLERARFANRGESGSDFTIAAPDGTWFGDPEKDHKIVLCDLSIKRSNETVEPTEFGQLRLSVSDEQSRLTPARVGLYRESGRMPLPSDYALTIHNYDNRDKQIFLRSSHDKVPVWPHENRFFFYIDGEYETMLPVGTYRLIVSKGPEYAVMQKTIEISADIGTAIAVPLSRWIDMPDKGWYSGDDHVHMTRTPDDNASISAVMQAEDIHITNLLQMGNPYDTHFTQYAFGKDGRYQAGSHALVPGVEDPRTAVRGHTISLNIREVYRPTDRYLRYEQIFAEYRKQGGMSGYAHVAGRLFNVERGLAIDVALGAVDFVELLQDGVLETQLWYDFLNLGFRLLPMAGSDFPYLSAPGGERNYVYVDGEFTVDAYYKALREERTFVTNGPMLEFSVNGQPMGSNLQLSPGDEVSIIAGAALNPDIEALNRIELVVHGDVVVAMDDVSADNTLSLQHTMTVEEGMWLAVRAYGAEQTVAHAAPVYITTDGGFEKRSAVPELARRMINKLREFDTVAADETQELESWSVGERLTTMLAEQRVKILERADEARAVYARMLDQR